jgi:plastocyanin
VIVALVAAPALAGCGPQNSYDSAVEHTATPSASGTAASPSAPATGAPATQEPATGTTVIIQGFAFVPRTLSVDAGTEVTWVNNETAPHDVTSTDGPGVGAATTDLFSSGRMVQGDSFSFTFDEPGTYYYECALHTSLEAMHAEVVVR